MRQQLCKNEWGRAKVSYRTRTQAEKHARGQVALHVYPCKFCGGWHLTSQAPLHKADTPPSAAKLRRILADRAALMASQQRRQDEVDARLKKAEESRRAAEAVYQEELAAIAAMVNRLQRV